MIESVDSLIKLVAGSGGVIGLTTLVKWLHTRDNRLELRIQRLENSQATKLGNEDARQLIKDLNAPLIKDIEYFKEILVAHNTKLDKQDQKLDKIIDKLV